VPILGFGAARAMTGPQDLSAAADPIIVHPGVRRMLLTQKAIAEGGRMMIYTCALLSNKVCYQRFFSCSCMSWSL
jgi:alkylation response protein AidB-like acyl-CoA dehydrogenase